ncbi:MAG: PDZ domain-containing protein, partial [Bacteroidales bacterium]|nr:PDZ domain-containing protein [Bacteroidales bacterium]
GELVGINTAIASRTGSFTGYSFAVPSSIAKKVVEDIIDYGTVQRALLGITMNDIDSKLAQEKNLTDTKGVYIAEVSKGGSAEKAGIKASDILVSINGNKVNSTPAVQEQINKFRPGEKINVGIVREGKEKVIPVVLDKRLPGLSELKSPDGEQINLFGAWIRKASDETLKKHDLKQGVEVVSVDEGKFRSAGIKPGFVITHVNQYPVKEPADILNIIERSRRSLLIEGQNPDRRIVYYGIGL